MTLPASGAISMSQVNTELGIASTTTISLNQSSVRTLFGKASGAISMSDGYGKANQFAFTISSNQTNANLRTLAVNAGWNQTSKVVATINSGVFVSANSTGSPALTVNGAFPGGVELVNNGFIVGQGGNGGNGADFATFSTYALYAPTAGGAGGLALSVSTGIRITNNGTIAGGGGGGGGGGGNRAAADYQYDRWRVGGGGGGGRTGTTNSSGGIGGDTGGWAGYVKAADGGAGTSSAAGSGGAGTTSTLFNPSGNGGSGGSGGGWGAGGSSGGAAANDGWLVLSVGPAGGGAAGAAVSGNGNITWAATGTRLGAIG